MFSQNFEISGGRIFRRQKYQGANALSERFPARALRRAPSQRGEYSTVPELLTEKKKKKEKKRKKKKQDRSRRWENALCCSDTHCVVITDYENVREKHEDFKTAEMICQIWRMLYLYKAERRAWWCGRYEDEAVAASARGHFAGFTPHSGCACANRQYR